MYYQLDNLGDKNGKELMQAFRDIPIDVTSLSLSGNDLDNRTGAELAQAFAAISATVTS
tara:strand:+ start:3391 stop:3567 length:177 start_codon:yes stop_codon:yes gene_type:complete